MWARPASTFRQQRQALRPLEITGSRVGWARIYRAIQGSTAQIRSPRHRAGIDVQRHGADPELGRCRFRACPGSCSKEGKSAGGLTVAATAGDQTTDSQGSGVPGIWPSAARTMYHVVNDTDQRKRRRRSGGEMVLLYVQ